MADIPIYNILNEGYKPTNLTGGHHLTCQNPPFSRCRAKFLSGGEHTLELRWIKLAGVTMMTWELYIQIS